LLNSFVRGLASLLQVALLVTSVCAAEENSSRFILPPTIKAIEAEGLHNLFALGTNVFSGSAPEGESAFTALAKLGVKTIITVDGAKPEVEMARKHGFRYVHLPHGYD